MHLIHILLPLYDNGGRKFKAGLYKAVKKTLANRFRGLTAYSRSAAEGLWHSGKSIQRDDIVVYEIMTQALDKKWWKEFQRSLEKMFQQQSIVIQVQKITLI